MSVAKVLVVAALAALASCGGPVRAPAPPSGELIAFGGGPGGPADACFACHGRDGMGAAETPRLAGIGAGYLNKQLNDYAHERRMHTPMVAIAQRLSDRDRRAVSAYYAELAATPQTARTAPALYARGALARGIRACADCHGARGQGRALANPAIAGQPAAYTIAQLRQFKRSIRRNDPRDMMGAAARGLTEAEIAALAAYLAP